MRGKGNIYPTSDYVTEHVMLANIHVIVEDVTDVGG
jgi:hypothetical protein